MYVYPHPSACFVVFNYQIYGEVQLAGDVPFTVLCGGYKCAIITAAYGLVIYVISIILEICKKPRI